MPNIYYAKSGGTCTNDDGMVDSGSARTGLWTTTASDYYPSCYDIFAGNTGTPIAAGDFIYCSDLHTFTRSSVTNFIGATNSQTDCIYIVSVDNANQDEYKAGASEKAVSGNDIVFYGRSVVWGMEILADDDFRSGGVNTHAVFIDCTIGLDAGGSHDRIQVVHDGAAFMFYDCTIELPNTAYLQVYNAGMMYLDGCTFNNSHAGDLIHSISGNGGATVTIKNCKGIDNTGYLLGEAGNDNSNDDLINVQIINSEVNASVTPVQEDLENRCHTFLMSGCSSDNDIAEYQHYFESVASVAEHNTTIYRDESEAWSDAEKVSLEVTTGADIEVFNPFTFEFPSEYIDLSATASDVIRIYFASTTALDPSNVWAQVSYADGTNAKTWNTATSRPDMLKPGTLTTDSGSDWRNGAGAFSGNEYYLDVDCSSPSGAACVVEIRIFVGIASTTVYFDVVTTQS